MKDLKNMTIEELQKVILESEELLIQLKEQRKKAILVEIEKDLKSLLKKMEEVDVSFCFGDRIERELSYEVAELKINYNKKTISINEW